MERSRFFEVGSNLKFHQILNFRGFFIKMSLNFVDLDKIDHYFAIPFEDLQKKIFKNPEDPGGYHMIPAPAPKTNLEVWLRRSPLFLRASRRGARDERQWLPGRRFCRSPPLELRWSSCRVRRTPRPETRDPGGQSHQEAIPSGLVSPPARLHP